MVCGVTLRPNIIIYFNCCAFLFRRPNLIYIHTAGGGALATVVLKRFFICPRDSSIRASHGASSINREMRDIVFIFKSTGCDTIVNRRKGTCLKTSTKRKPNTLKIAHPKANHTKTEQCSHIGIRGRHGVWGWLSRWTAHLNLHRNWDRGKWLHSHYPVIALCQDCMFDIEHILRFILFFAIIYLFKKTKY